jgi:acetolactate synthase-1/2/3 large subunit
MKLTTAAALLVTTVSPHADAFAVRGNGRTAFSATTTPFDVHNPTRGNVSRRKIKMWHDLCLEPWCGLKMSLHVDDELAKLMEEALDSVEVNEDESLALEYEAKALVLRNEAKKYMSAFEGETGAHVIYTKLVEHGVEVVNGYSGGAVLPLLDQFSSDHPRHNGEEAKIRWITNSNESSAGHVAQGIAKSSKLGKDGKALPGVVVATSGPGVTNLITPLQDAICDGVPMVVLCGQAATNAPPAAFQQAPAVALTTPCTKWSYQITSAAELPFVLDYAFYVAKNGRPGPVFIDLPKDLQIQKITKEGIEEFVDKNLEFGRPKHPLLRLQPMHCTKENSPEVALNIGREGADGLPFHFENDELKPTPITTACAKKGIDSFRADHTPSNMINRKFTFSEKIDEMMSLIMNAKKPVIIAGQGCNDSSEELVKFAEALQIPVATTLHALGCFDERHPLALNMIGMHGHPTPNYMTQESDLVICIGSRFDDRITGNMGAFIPEAKKASSEGRGGVIHVDIRLSENAKQVKPDYFVHSTGRTFLQQANAYIDNLDASTPIGHSTKNWLLKMKELQQEFPVKVPKFNSEIISDPNSGEAMTKTIMSAQHVISTLNQLILDCNKMDDCLFTTGVGIHQMVAAQLLTWTQPRQMLSSGSLGTMGVALGFCIGAKLANGNKICIAIDGDGSFNMTFTELKTVAEQNIPVKILILDNESQMMVEYWQRLFCAERYIAVTNTQNPEYTKLAEAFGIKSLYCDCEEDLPEKMKQFLLEDNDKPVLFHVKILRTPCLPLVAPGQALDNMILEDVSDQEVDKSAAPS